MARVVMGGRRAAIDPLKHSQALGGALVFLGLARSMPLAHGSQGCASFAKALLTRHFREPIPLQTTAVTEITAVLGAGDSLAAALDTIRERQHPEIIGVLTTGLTEVNGEDVTAELNSYLERAGDTGQLLIHASTPDFRGGLSDGWAAALDALVRAVPLDGPADPGDPGDPAGSREPVAVLTGPAMSAVDLDELAELICAYGLDPILVPDLSGSLDGHLADAWSPLTTGGTTLSDLRRLGRCRLLIAVGATTASSAAGVLALRTGAEVVHLPHLSGLGAVDALVKLLSRHTGVVAPPRLRRWRARLADGLLDTHFVLSGARIALALEPDLLSAVASLLTSAGAEIVSAVSPTPSPVLHSLPCAEVVVGDLADLAERAGAAGAELVLAGSHARDVAARIGAAHLPVGFPVYDRLGAALRGAAGYRGSLSLLMDAANRLLDHRERHDHRGHRDHRHHSTVGRADESVAESFEESMC